MNKIKQLLRPFYCPIVNFLTILKSQYWNMMAQINPSSNAKAEMKRQKQKNLLRPVNLKQPLYFNEKMLWLKYYLYNKSEIVGKCYNKYLVREYIQSKGLGHILNELYFVADSIDSIPWHQLPEECVVKLSNGYKGHVFKKRTIPFDVERAKKVLRDATNRCKYAFKISGDLFVYKTEPVYVCEKMLYASDGIGLPEDYKIHCFHGEPYYLEYIYDRDYESKTSFYKSAFVDINTMQDRHDLEGEASPIEKIELPKSFSRMLEYSKILSSDFPYVRVDFYEDAGEPIFGELTFTPYHNQTEKSLTELGSLIHLEDIEKYYKILVK